MAKVKSKKPVKKQNKAVKKAVSQKKKVTVKSASKKVAKKVNVRKAAKQNVKKAVVRKAVKKSPAKKVIKKTVAKKAAKKAIITKTASVQKSTKKAVAIQMPAERIPHKKAEIIKQKAKKIKIYKKNSKTRYTVKELLHFKKLLLEEKDRIIASARANMRTLVDSESGEYVGDDSSYASHMAEQGTDEMEREKNYMFVQRDEKYLGYIEEALTRVDQGTYGLCIDCIDEPKNLCATCPLIPRERLEIVPITQHCIECKNIRG